MNRFWVAVARFAAKRAGGNFVRIVTSHQGPTWSMPDPTVTTAATATTMTWKPQR